MRVIVVLVLPAKILDNACDVLPQRCGEVDLSIERFEQVLGNVARAEHSVLCNDVRGIIACDEVRELIVERRAERNAGVVDGAAVYVRLEYQALLGALLVGCDIVESEVLQRTRVAAWGRKGRIKLLVLLVGHVQTCVGVGRGGSLGAGGGSRSVRRRIGVRRAVRSFVVARRKSQEHCCGHRAGDGSFDSRHFILPFTDIENIMRFCVNWLYITGSKGAEANLLN